MHKFIWLCIGYPINIRIVFWRKKIGKIIRMVNKELNLIAVILGIWKCLFHNINCTSFTNRTTLCLLSKGDRKKSKYGGGSPPWAFSTTLIVTSNKIFPFIAYSGNLFHIIKFGTLKPCISQRKRLTYPQKCIFKNDLRVFSLAQPSLEK